MHVLSAVTKSLLTQCVCPGVSAFYFSIFLCIACQTLRSLRPCLHAYMDAMHRNIVLMKCLRCVQLALEAKLHQVSAYHATWRSEPVPTHQANFAAASRHDRILHDPRIIIGIR
jgi:hypothetical protein